MWERAPAASLLPRCLLLQHAMATHPAFYTAAHPTSLAAPQAKYYAKGANRRLVDQIIDAREAQ